MAIILITGGTGLVGKYTDGTHGSIFGKSPPALWGPRSLGQGSVLVLPVSGNQAISEIVYEQSKPMNKGKGCVRSPRLSLSFLARLSSHSFIFNTNKHLVFGYKTGSGLRDIQSKVYDCGCVPRLKPRSFPNHTKNSVAHRAPSLKPDLSSINTDQNNKNNKKIKF